MLIIEVMQLKAMKQRERERERERETPRNAKDKLLSAEVSKQARVSKQTRTMLPATMTCMILAASCWSPLPPRFPCTKSANSWSGSRAVSLLFRFSPEMRHTYPTGSFGRGCKRQGKKKKEPGRGRECVIV